MTYEEIKQNIIRLLERTPFTCLATANKNGEVSNSQVCLINDGLTVYTQTDESFEKAENIRQNSNVALNCGAYYFKGKAEIVGRPKDNEKFVSLIKQKHLSTYNHYTNLPSEVLIKITLTEARIWGVDNSKDIHNQETITVVDLTSGDIKTINCDKM